MRPLRHLVLASVFLLLGAISSSAQTPGPSLYYVFVRASRVALLPFTNVAEAPELSADVMAHLRRELVDKSVELADSSQTAAVLRKYRIRNTAEPTISQIQKLSEELDVSYLLVGTIDYARTEESASEIALSARLIYIPTVEIVWCASASAHSDDVGLPLGIGQTQQMPRLISRTSARLLHTFRYAPVRKAQRVDTLQLYKRSQMIAGPCRAILVLPFANETPARAAGYAIANQFMTELMREGYAIIEPARVKEALQESGISSGEISRELLAKCRDELGVDFILTGTVSSYSNSYHPERGDEPDVSVQARLIDARDGTIVWAKSRERRGSNRLVLFGYGAVHGLGALARSVVRDLAHAIPHTSHMEAPPNPATIGYAQ